MSDVDNSKLPVPIEATDFRFLTSPASLTHAVLELDTATNPARFFLTKTQLLKLSVQARKAADRFS